MNGSRAVNDEWYPTGPNKEGEDTRERKKWEMITETMRKRRTQMTISRRGLREYCLIEWMS